MMKKQNVIMTSFISWMYKKQKQNQEGSCYPLISYTPRYHGDKNV